MLYRLLLSLVLLAGIIVTNAQQVITIDNPSFEDAPRMGTNNNYSINGWYDCGALNFKGESPPDIHPGNFWMVKLAPSHGSTYLGMVVRDNDTWEGLSQRLASPIEAGKCYSFTIDLAQSPEYKSHSRMKTFYNPKSKRYEPLPQNFNTPAVLRVWGGAGFCDDKELLAESTPINHADWRTYDFKIKSKFSHSFLMVEVYYKTPAFLPYCGHLLLDNLSNIIEESCDKPNNDLAAVEPTKPSKSSLPPHKAGRIPDAPKKNIQSTVTPTPPNKKKKLLADLDVKKLKQGSTVEIKNLYFKADTSDMNEESYEVLEEVYDFLKDNPKIIVELGGHTNGQPSHEYCDKLSTARAKAVYDYLVLKGIDKSKLDYKGYGKRRRIATDKTAEGRLKNQRVEIKILSLG